MSFSLKLLTKSPDYYKFSHLNQLPYNVLSYLRSCIHTIHTQRYQGYINKFPANSDETIGFIVRNDEPNKEYIFHVDDIHSEDIRVVRQYENIEFDIMDGNPYKRAKNITAASKQLLKYHHQNSSLNIQLRTQRLSELPNAFKQRFTGIVQTLHSTKNDGFIIPDQLYSDFVYFDSSEIHSTGIAKLNKNDKVSFYVTNSYKNKKNRKDVAIAIRRSDDGLITFEDFELGNHRRILGEIYNKYDKIANIKSEYLNNRYRGYIIHKHKDGLLGYILPFQSMDDFVVDELISVHVDDCHMSGNRKLRRFQEVEFCIMFNNAMNNVRCRYKAIQVTAPNLSVIHYNEENYLSNFVKNKEFVIKYDENSESEQRFKGIITDIKKHNENKTNLYEITPNIYGYKPIFQYEKELRCVGTKALQIGDAVEFNIDYQTQKPFYITAEGGYPFICEYSNSEYSKYLRSKCKLSTFRRYFVLYQNNYGEGFISSFNEERQCGTIEIIGSNDDVRYKQILFHLKDVNQKQLNRIKNQKVLFELMEMGTINGYNNTEFVSYIWRKDLDLTKKAINVKLFEINKHDKTMYNENDKQNKRLNTSTNTYVVLTKINKIMHQKISHLRY